MVVRRRRELAATPEEVWAVVGDPFNLPRWWPKVERVEQVDASGFTEVFRTDKGRVVRADFRITQLREAQAIGFSQDLAGTAFERVLTRSETTIALEPLGSGTAVALTLDQGLAGLARLGGLMVRRASRAQLDRALDALAETVV